METIQKSIMIYAIISYLIFAAACLGQISAISLVAVVGLSLLLILPLRRLRCDPSERLALTGAQKRALYFASGVILILFAHVMILPPYARDDVIYHLLVPKQLLGDGGFRFDPYNINSNFPMLFEMPLTLSMLSNGWISPFLANYMVLLSLCIAFYLMARRVFGVNHTLSLAATCALATTPVVYDQVRSCYVELFMALLVLATFYNYFLFRSRRHQPMYWYLTMVFAGLLCATKYTGGVFVLFLLAVEFFAGEDRAQYYKGALICVAVGFVWYLKNWILLGNPVYPLLAFLFPSEFVSVERSIFYKHLFADYHWGRGWIDYLLLPWRLLVGFDPEPAAGRLGFGGQLSFLYIIAFASIAALLKKAGSSHLAGHKRVVGMLFAGYAVFWAATSQQVRFLLPVLILSLLPGLSLINTHWKRWRLPVLIFFGLVVVQNAVNIGATVQSQKIGALLSGQMTREQFLDFHMPISHQMANKLNGMLDPGRHRLMAIGNFGRNFYYDTEVITNTYYEAEILARAFHIEKGQSRIFEEFIEAETITHLLINHAYLDQFFSQNPSFDMEALKGYLSRLPVVLRQKAAVVYQLKG